MSEGMHAPAVGWRDYVDLKVDATDKRLTAEIRAASERALALSLSAEKMLARASETLDWRLETLNGAKEQARIDSANFARIDQVERVRERVETLEKKGSNLDGRFWALGAAMFAMTVIINIAGFILARRP